MKEGKCGKGRQESNVLFNHCKSVSEVMDYRFVRFCFLMVVSMKMIVFWNVAPCVLIEIDSFRGSKHLVLAIGPKVCRLKPG
jgi:hypothetical protein